jgi:hypothetical protein
VPRERSSDFANRVTHAVFTAARTGVGHVSAILHRDILASLVEETKGVHFTEADASESSVEQIAKVAVIRDLNGSRLPVTRALVTGVTDAARACSSELPALAAFAPNELTFMRYDGPGAGIGAHLDRRRYALLVFVLTLAGAAVLSTQADRVGLVELSRWTCRPGDLVVLRAPGLNSADGRPLHRVSGPPAGERISLSIRMDTSDPDAHWSSGSAQL